MDSVRVVQRGLIIAFASFLLSFCLIQQDAAAQESEAGERIPANCRITLPADGEFVPPASSFAGRAPLMEDQFWFGTEKLWTILPRDGTWRGPFYVDPSSSGDLAKFVYSNKFAWFRFPDFSEEDGPLTVTGKRLDGPDLSFTESFGVAVISPGRTATKIMLGGIDIPTYGCWEITGHYKDEELSFTVWVARRLEQAWAPTPDAASAQKLAPRRTQVDGATQAKLLVYQTIPNFPAAAKAADISGTVVLHAIIGTDGRPHDLQYLSGPPLLAQGSDRCSQMVAIQNRGA